jgi:endonuclease YncB( thermonuclease family)
LALATYENTPEYTLAGLRAPVKVLKLVDGDTADIALASPDTQRIYRYRIRLWGIDTPEKRPSRSDPNRHLEIEASYRAKEALEARCQENNYLVTALFYHPDKYGRLLCTLYDQEGRDMNQWMIAEGHAMEYFGKTKKKFQAATAATAATAVTAATAATAI